MHTCELKVSRTSMRGPWPANLRDTSTGLRSERPPSPDGSRLVMTRRGHFTSASLSESAIAIVATDKTVGREELLVRVTAGERKTPNVTDIKCGGHAREAQIEVSHCLMPKRQ